MKSLIKPFTTFILSFLISSICFAQTDSLRVRINHIILSKHADVGVAILGIESKDTLSINGSKHYPMQSVFKFHIALTVLNEIEKGKLTLDQKIYIKESDLDPNTWSPLQQKYPKGNVELSLSEILGYTVSQSDNNGCDILLRLVGGATKVDNYIHSIGIKDIEIKATEQEMRKAWDVQFTNWTTPLSAIDLLRKFYGKEFLSGTSFEFLWKTLLETSTYKNRIKGELPEGTPVAHKTGTSGKKDGITAAVNDIGIVVLPNRNHFAIVVFVSNSRENDDTNNKIIADIAKVTWDYFINKK